MLDRCRDPYTPVRLSNRFAALNEPDQIDAREHTDLGACVPGEPIRLSGANPRTRAAGELDGTADLASRRVRRADAHRKGIHIMETVVAQNLNVVEEPEFIKMDLVIDSGAADHVADTREAPGYEVVPSQGSRQGECWKTASGDLIPNRGEMVLDKIGRAHV